MYSTWTKIIVKAHSSGLNRKIVPQVQNEHKRQTILDILVVYVFCARRCLNKNANSQALKTHRCSSVLKYPAISYLGCNLIKCFWMNLLFCLCFSRSSWAILQFDLVPQSYPRSLLHTSDWLCQWPMYSAMGPKETIHSGPVCRCAAGSSAVFKWIINRWVED